MRVEQKMTSSSVNLVLCHCALLWAP